MHPDCPSRRASDATLAESAAALGVSSGLCSRREVLGRTALGIGGLAASMLLARDGLADGGRQAIEIDPLAPLATRKPHLPGKAKHLIVLFQYGGPSAIDLFDYKPLVQELAGKPVPKSFKEVSDAVGGVFNGCKDSILCPPWKWRQHGEGGLWISDRLPETARHADRLCVVKSMHCDSSNHGPATYQMNTGVILGGKPSLGSWVTYGLGSENDNLPGYVLLFEVGGIGGSVNWSNAFLPAAFQGTRFRHQGPPLVNLDPPASLASVQRSTLDLAQAFNKRHRDSRPGRPDLDGRIATYELAYRMQAEAADVGDLSDETAETLAKYGVDDKDRAKASYGRMLLLSRRLVERGVRVVQIYNAVDKFGWDAHDSSHDYHERNSRQIDGPTAALLDDLARRGMLDETLVVWGGEFGRTPMEQGSGGRNHNPYGFTVWLAGGGVQGGRSIGSTDEIGLRAVDDRQHIRDLHATILRALGLDHERLTFEHDGREERITGVLNAARPIPGVLG
jgi:hypothetical protein